MSAFTVSNIKPSLKIDANQRYILGLDEFPEPVGSIKVDNIFIPTVGVPAVTKEETRNNALSGFRWVHTTNSTDTFGSFILESFINAAPSGISLLKFNQNGTITFSSVTSFDNNANFDSLATFNNNANFDSLATFNNNANFDSLATFSDIATFNNDAIFNGDVIFNTPISLPNNINVNGNTQSFTYAANAVASFNLKNTQIPTVGVPTNTILNLSNEAANGGFRFNHIYEDEIHSGFGKLVLGSNNTYNILTEYATFGYSSIGASPGTATIVPNTTFGTVTANSVNATLAVNGGKSNVSDEATCLRVLSTNLSTKIELMNEAVGGKLYELRSNADGSFGIKNRSANTDGYILDSLGNHVSGGVSYMSRPTVFMTMQNNALATTIVTAGVYVKVAGTTNTSARNAFTEPAGISNRVVFAGDYTIFGLINISFTYSHNGAANDEVSFALFRDGVQITSTIMSDTSGATGRFVQMSICGHIAFNPNQYIELWCTHPVNNRTITVKRLQFTIA
jgi:hypothetical protein